MKFWKSFKKSPSRPKKEFRSEAQIFNSATFKQLCLLHVNKQKRFYKLRIISTDKSLRSVFENKNPAIPKKSDRSKTSYISGSDKFDWLEIYSDWYEICEIFCADGSEKTFSIAVPIKF